MSSLFALSIVTAVLCGAWSCLAEAIGLPGWAGFAGCTAYFASGKHGVAGLKKAIPTNLAGVLCAMALLALSGMFPALGSAGIWCAVVTFVMCIIAKYEWFDYCPGTFIGCFSTFAAGGEWMVLAPVLVFGAFLAAACDYGGMRLYQAVTGDSRHT
ncbi:MAG: DUF1097 domain-containing protein [Eubacterium sp.]|nr:DUF1097 domain-containing protein [Eubacterium sp.]